MHQKLVGIDYNNMNIWEKKTIFLIKRYISYHKCVAKETIFMSK